MQITSYLIFLLPVGETVGGWVDPDTKLEFRSTLPLTGGDDREYELVRVDCRFRLIKTDSLVP
jgi:hypothetical protein